MAQDLDARDKALAAAVALLAAEAGEGDASALRGRFADGEAAGVGCLDDHLSHLSGDRERGRTAAFQMLGPVKGDAVAAAGLVDRALILSGGLDGLSPGAAATLREICEALNLSPTRFGL